METDHEAQQLLENAVAEATAGRQMTRHRRAEMTSHLHDAATRRAHEDGRTTIQPADVAGALDEAGGPGALGAAFAPDAPTPALALSRAAAHSLDLLIVYGGLMAAWAAAWVALALTTTWTGLDVGWWRPDPYQLIDIDDLPLRPGIPGAARGYALAALLLLAPISYFVAFEATTGGTPGKRAIGLRVVRIDGSRPGAPAALMRSALKATPLLWPALALDALALRNGRGQRASDQLAGTCVVHDADRMPTRPATPA